MKVNLWRYGLFILLMLSTSCANQTRSELVPETRTLPAGTLTRGDPTLHPIHHANIVHDITLDTFEISIHPITNAQFKAFVDDTQYLTYAERKFSAELFPGLPPEQLAEVEEIYTPGAMVFTPPPQNTSDLSNPLAWWNWVENASWQHPEGPDSNIDARMDHPVVQICWADALAYCAWLSESTGLHVSLPTEAEFEYAARGGLIQARYTWGNEADTNHTLANIWQGNFPNTNTELDGFAATSPVKSFPANNYELYDMSGNVWEWCMDTFNQGMYAYCQQTTPIVSNPVYLGDGYEKSTRGGSYLCSDAYCHGYRPGARMHSSPDTALNHTGFRIVIRAGDHPLHAQITPVVKSHLPE